MARKLSPHDQLRRQHNLLLDRTTIILMTIWAASESVKPFESDDFWWSQSATELRSMPEYQVILGKVRGMIA